LFPLGVLRSITPQQGHLTPTYVRNSVHTEHIFCPFSYLCRPSYPTALNLIQIPLHTFTNLLFYNYLDT